MCLFIIISSFFCFKQKTAYEMRISDWSSDVCSSDLFGNFGGLPVKFAYFGLGLALTIVVATGTSIWLGKRARRGLHDPPLRSLWDAVLRGVPPALVLTFLARILAGHDTPLTPIFWLLPALTLLAAPLRPEPRPRRLTTEDPRDGED